MTENANIAPLGSLGAFDPADERPNMVCVEHVSMVFNMAAEQLDNLKEYAIALMRRELMFKEFRALDDVSLCVKKGDVFGIMGTNGSGKSTLLKIIAGVLEPTQGTVQINGNIAPLIELGAGFDMELTARENIYLNGALLGYSKKFISQHFDEIVEFAEVEQFLDIPLKNYSSGMVARIAFAIATVIVPDILIVDEVLSVGDFMFQQKCERRIQSLIKEHGVTVLLVSHNNDQIQRLCNKAIWIEKGHTRMIGPAKEVCKVYGLVGGREGSAESESLILETYASESLSDDTANFRKIPCEPHYPLSAKMIPLEKEDRDTLTIARAEDPVASMLAASLAALKDAAFLQVTKGFLPKTIKWEGERLIPKNIIIVEGQEPIDQLTLEYVAIVFPEASIERLSADSPSQLSLRVYEHGMSAMNPWASSVAVTAPHNKADILSISPYLFESSVPLLYIDEPGVIPPGVLEAIGSFDSVILLGGNLSFPQACVSKIDDSVSVERLFGNGPYDAYRKIGAWVKGKASHGEKAKRNRLIASFSDVNDVLAAGLIAVRQDADLLLYDERNMDSLAAILKNLRENAPTIQSVLIVGAADSVKSATTALFPKALSSGQL